MHPLKLSKPVEKASIGARVIHGHLRSCTPFRIPGARQGNSRSQASALYTKFRTEETTGTSFALETRIGGERLLSVESEVEDVSCPKVIHF